MKHLADLNLLIDAASAIAGNDSKLAALLGQHRSKVSDWRRGTQDCPPEDQALMASIAGYDAVQTLIRATVEKHEGKPKGDLLMKVLGKPSLAIGGVAGFAGAVALAIFSMVPMPSQATPIKNNTMCIMLNDLCNDICGKSVLKDHV